MSWLEVIEEDGRYFDTNDRIGFEKIDIMMANAKLFERMMQKDLKRHKLTSEFMKEMLEQTFNS